jgi:acyl carrier protein
MAEPTALIDLVAGVLKLTPAELTEESGMHDTREWDSLHHVMVMLEIEKVYGIALEDEDMAEAISIPEIRRVLAKHQAG